MRKIKELTIVEEQKIQLSTLKFLDDICNKEKITYFLAYGTLLGAAREGKFIAWDDDIDIWMKREDYRRFEEVWSKYGTEKYFLQTKGTDKYYLFPEMMRICVNGTYKWPEGFENLKFHKGIYLDIFPLDYASKLESENLKRIKKCSVIHSLLYKKLPHSKSTTIKGCISNIIAKVVPLSVLNKEMTRTIEGGNKDNHKQLISFAASFVYPGCVHDAELFADVRYIQFEDMKCPCPVGYETVLRERYGENWRIPVQYKPEYVKAYLIEQ